MVLMANLMDNFIDRKMFELSHVQVTSMSQIHTIIGSRGLTRISCSLQNGAPRALQMDSSTFLMRYASTQMVVCMLMSYKDQEFKYLIRTESFYGNGALWERLMVNLAFLRNIFG